MKRLNCAIYTRKSSDEGLEKEFNSLDAQREACEALITSQKHAGWMVVRDLYDDGGLSGGTMERPALQRLLGDITSGKMQIVVVYKVDRLTRSLADFAKIVDVLDSHSASFVSVTQSFNTTTSMGRLTLNMLLSFAQFEREFASERIRDKIAASKAKEQDAGDTLSVFDLDAANFRSSISKAIEFSDSWAALPSIKIRELVRSIVERVCVRVDEVVVSLNRKEIAKILVGEATRELPEEQFETTELRAEARLRRAGKGIRLIVGGGRAAKPDRQMIVLLRNAYATREALMSGRDATIDALARRLGVRRDYLSAHMRLTYLAPGIVNDLFEGRQSEGLTAARLVSLCKDLPHDWQLQRAVLGIETR